MMQATVSAVSFHNSNASQLNNERYNADGFLIPIHICLHAKLCRTEVKTPETELPETERNKREERKETFDCSRLGMGLLSGA